MAWGNGPAIPVRGAATHAPGVDHYNPSAFLEQRQRCGQADHPGSDHQHVSFFRALYSQDSPISIGSRRFAQDRLRKKGDALSHDRDWVPKFSPCHHIPWLIAVAHPDCIVSVPSRLLPRTLVAHRNAIRSPTSDLRHPRSNLIRVLRKKVCARTCCAPSGLQRAVRCRRGEGLQPEPPRARRASRDRASLEEPEQHALAGLSSGAIRRSAPRLDAHRRPSPIGAPAPQPFHWPVAIERQPPPAENHLHCKQRNDE